MAVSNKVMKKKILIILSIILSVILFISLIFCGIKLVSIIRWDKVPIIGAFVLEPRKHFGVEASCYKEPITLEQLDDEPIGWTVGRGYWFNKINGYTRGLLKKYMKENNLAIVPKDYNNLETSIRIEELLEELEFVSLE